jgi:hypothetical protein
VEGGDIFQGVYPLPGPPPPSVHMYEEALFLGIYLERLICFEEKFANSSGGPAPPGGGGGVK